MIPCSMPLRVLVVDDDADNRDLLVLMVERLGHSADRACDGVGAIAALQHGPAYDVVLLDMTMPRMTGEDVMRWLQQHPGSATGLRVAVVTASPDDDRRVVLETLGAHAVLPKPLHLQQLRDLIGGNEPERAVAG